MVYRIILISFSIFLSHHVKAQNGILIDPRDGKEYKTVQIGKQIWMAENLACKLEIVNQVKYSSLMFADYFSDSLVDLPDHSGFLYNWNAAQSACPSGWRLPNQVDFQILMEVVGGEKKAIFKALTENGSKRGHGYVICF